MSKEITHLIEQQLPTALDRFVRQELGQGLTPLGEDGCFQVYLAGSLPGSLVADLLGHAGNRGTDGVLVAMDQEVVRSLYFKKGRITAADSNVVFERLGRLLGAANVLVEADARMLVDLEELEGVAAAVSRLPEEAALWGLEKRAREIAAGLYLMPRAHFVLLDGEPDLGGLPRLSLPPMELAVEGLRRYDEWRNRSDTPPSTADELRMALRRLAETNPHAIGA